MFKNIQRTQIFANAHELPAMAFSPFTLRFNESWFERLFVREHVNRDLPQSVLYMGIGLSAYVTYAILDFLVLEGDELWNVVSIRLMVCPLLALLIGACFLPNIHRKIQLILSTCMLISGVGIIAMTAVISEPFSHMYYAGLILTVIYCSNFIVLRFVYSTIVSLVLFGLYLTSAMLINPIPDWALINNTFFLTVTLGWTIWTSYWSDYYIRSDFANRYLLIQEKKRSEDLLEAAEAGNRSKSEFLAVMSHELRTPLNAIIGFSEVIQQRLFGPVGSEKYESYIDDIADSGRHLLSVINDILDLSKAEAGKLEINEDDVPACDVIDQTMRMFRENAAVDGIRLAFDVPEDEVILRVDPRQFRQVVINLLSNAVKFTQRGGSVYVALEMVRDGSCRMTVEDTGIGIAEEDIPKVTDPFVQVESSLSRENGGIGLGLPLVKKIVELHGASLHISSKLGVGTRVTISVPPERVAQSPAMSVEQVTDVA